MPQAAHIPDALLLISSGCPHCPSVLQGLSELVKGGQIGALEVVNVGAHPERAAALGVRSVPWLRLGPFALEGLIGPAELRRWAERAASGEDMAGYFAEKLAAGGLAEVEALLTAEPQHLPALLELVADSESPMQVRLGVAALLEQRAGSKALQALVPRLAELSAAADHRVRSDACHYLGLSGSPAAAAALRARLQDPNGEVREIAAEALAETG